MFLVVGKGIFMKDNLVEKLTEWNFSNPSETITQVERSGKMECNGYRILTVR